MHCLSERPVRLAGKSESGFTLLELIIVCALIGLMLVASVPALRDSMLSDPLKKGGRKLIGYVQTVREKSVRERQPYLLYFDLAENRVYHLSEVEADKESRELPEKNILNMPGDVEITDIWTKSGGKMDSGVPELWISRQGYIDKSVIHLEDGSGNAISLVIATFLPEIEVRDNYFEPE